MNYFDSELIIYVKHICPRMSSASLAHATPILLVKIDLLGFSFRIATINS